MKKLWQYTPIGHIIKNKKHPIIGCLFLVFMMSTSLLQAQSLEIVPMAGYTLRSTFNVFDGRARILGNFTKGGTVTYNINPYYGVEFSYFNQRTDAITRSLALQDDDVPLNVNYILVGGVKKFPINEFFIPYTGVNFGAVGFVPTQERYESGWRFAFGVKAGSKFMLSERIGLRIQAMAHTPFSGLGTTIFLRPSGSSIGVSAYGTVIQVAFMGGLVLRVF